MALVHGFPRRRVLVLHCCLVVAAMTFVSPLRSLLCTRQNIIFGDTNPPEREPPGAWPTLPETPGITINIAVGAGLGDSLIYEPASVCYSRLAQSHSSVQETYCNYEENLRVGKYEIK